MFQRIAHWVLVSLLLVGGLVWTPPPAEARSGKSAPDDVSAVKVTFAGFQRLTEKRFRVFVDMSAKPVVDVDKKNNTITFAFGDSRIPLKNNKNPLDLTHFANPLVRAQLKQTKRDVHLVLTFRGEVDTEHRFVDREDGSVTLQVDFP